MGLCGGGGQVVGEPQGEECGQPGVFDNHRWECTWPSVRSGVHPVPRSAHNMGEQQGNSRQIYWELEAEDALWVE